MAPDVRFAEIRKKLRRHGWSLTRINGSHHVFTGPGREPISVPVHQGKVKHVYLRNIEKAIKELGEEGAD